MGTIEPVSLVPQFRLTPQHIRRCGDIDALNHDQLVARVKDLLPGVGMEEAEADRLAGPTMTDGQLRAVLRTLLGVPALVSTNA